jgi:hypothetical protein
LGDDPHPWLADVLASINDYDIHRLNELLLWSHPPHGAAKLVPGRWLPQRQRFCL